MSADYKKLVKPYHDESLVDLAKWIQIDSVYDETTKTEEHPFGNGVAAALEYIAKLGEKHGFEVDRCDGYCTEISYGKGPLIAIYAHTDVVPVSGTWHHEPFGAEIENDIMYGRGTSDDKGPAMAAFTALRALKDNGLIDNYRVSLVIGGNEESGSLCLEHYFHAMKKPYPKYGFTPDGAFPLIYGEKGITGYAQRYTAFHPGLINVHGGVASNSVIDEAHAVFEKGIISRHFIKTFFLVSDARYEFKEGDDQDELIVYGKAAHGSTPELGLNAGLHLLKCIALLYKDGKLADIADDYLETSGKKMGLYEEGKYLHGTTFNVGLISKKDDTIELFVNYRYPETTDPHQTEEKLKAMKLGDIEFFGYGEYLLVDPESDFIQTLKKVYQEESGDYETPIMTIGGGTYAKESKNTVAFGSAFPHRNDKIHSPDEEIHLSDFFDSQGIYARAIVELGHLK